MKIQLYRTDKGWMARYSGDGSQRITRLFGTNVIPTAFTVLAKASVVKTEIEHLNPSAEVSLDHSEQGSALTPVVAILTVFSVGAVLIAQSGLVNALLARFAQVIR